VLVLGAIVDQQQDGCRRHTLTQQLQPGLGLAIEPVQIFDQQQQGLVQAFAQQHPGDRLEGAAAAQRGIHLGQLGGGLSIPQQGQQVGQGVFQAPIQGEQLARHLLAPPPRLILGRELEVVFEQLQQRQIRIRLAVRHGKSLQHQATVRSAQLELVVQP